MYSLLFILLLMKSYLYFRGETELLLALHLSKNKYGIKAKDILRIPAAVVNTH